ncbi:Nitronate monooxygenase [compost metagenome]
MNASERDTRLLFRSLRNTARVLRNSISVEVVNLERRPGGCEFEELRPLVAGVRGRAALETGEVENGVITAGQVVGLIEDIPSCEELMQRIVFEARQHLANARGYFSEEVI